MLVAKFLGLISILIGTASCVKPLGKEVCVASCNQALAKVVFNGKNGTLCSNDMRLTSIFYCAKIHCDDSVMEAGLAWLKGSCKFTQPVTVKAFESATSNATAAFLASIPVVDLKVKTVQNTTVVPSENNWYLSFKTINTYSAERDLHNSLRWAEYGFWGLVLLLGIATRLFTLLYHSSSTLQDTESGSKSAKDKGQIGVMKFRTWIRGYITLSPAFGHHYHESFGWATVPLRLQSIVIVFYIILHIMLIPFGYVVFDNNGYYNSRPTQVLRYFSDRVAVLMSSSLPFIWLFGIRNNPFLWMTGWTYRTFSIFHRWVARIFVTEAILHGAGMTAFYINDGGYDEYALNLGERYFRCGILALVAVCVTVIFSLYPFRKFSYEAFRIAHILMGITFLAAFYHHTWDQFVGQYLTFIWVCSAIWGYDYVMRLIRLFVFNFRYLGGKHQMGRALYSEATDMIRLEVARTSKGPLTPGLYYFIYFPTQRFWESHPFSLASWNVENEREKRSVLQDFSGSANKETSVISTSLPYPEAQSAAEPAHLGENSSGEAPNHRNLSFIVKPRSGMTRRLKATLKKRGSNTFHQLPILIEGPYGCPANFDGFSDVLFIAGGSGITAVLPYLRLPNQKMSLNNASQSLRLAWVAKKEAFIQDILSRELAPILGVSRSDHNIRADLYVTQSSVIGETKEYTSNVTFHTGKPDLENAVQETFDQSRKSLAVFVCGPGKMADSVRSTVVSLVRQGNSNIELFEEVFGW